MHRYPWRCLGVALGFFVGVSAVCTPPPRTPSCLVSAQGRRRFVAPLSLIFLHSGPAPPLPSLLSRGGASECLLFSSRKARLVPLTRIFLFFCADVCLFFVNCTPHVSVRGAERASSAGMMKCFMQRDVEEDLQVQAPCDIMLAAIPPPPPPSCTLCLREGSMSLVTQRTRMQKRRPRRRCGNKPLTLEMSYFSKGFSRESYTVQQSYLCETGVVCLHDHYPHLLCFPPQGVLGLPAPALALPCPLIGPEFNS